jgi:hypothetical protein
MEPLLRAAPFSFYFYEKAVDGIDLAFGGGVHSTFSGDGVVSQLFGAYYLYLRFI